MEALVSGQQELALAIADDGRVFAIRARNVTEVIAIEYVDLAILLRDARDFEMCRVSTCAELVFKLEQAFAREHVLQLFLMTLDPSLPDSLRCELAVELEWWLCRPGTAPLLEAILYSAPLPAAADPNEASRIASEQNAQTLSGLLYLLADHQPEIKRCCALWADLPIAVFGEDETNRRAWTTAAARSGFFRALVLDMREINAVIRSALESVVCQSSAEERRLFAELLFAFKDVHAVDVERPHSAIAFMERWQDIRTAASVKPAVAPRAYDRATRLDDVTEAFTRLSVAQRELFLKIAERRTSRDGSWPSGIQSNTESEVIAALGIALPELLAAWDRTRNSRNELDELLELCRILRPTTVQQQIAWLVTDGLNGHSDEVDLRRSCLRALAQTVFYDTTLFERYLTDSRYADVCFRALCQRRISGASRHLHTLFRVLEQDDDVVRQSLHSLIFETLNSQAVEALLVDFISNVDLASLNQLLEYLREIGVEITYVAIGEDEEFVAKQGAGRSARLLARLPVRGDARIRILRQRDAYVRMGEQLPPLERLLDDAYLAAI